MKFSLPLVAGLAASVAAHPQNGKKAGVTTTTTTGTSTTAVPTSAKGSMPSLPFLPTWLFRDAGNRGQGQGIENGLKCISTYNNCLVKSTNVVDCASAYGSCIKGGSSATGSTTISATGSATLTTKPAILTIPSATGAPTRTFARPQIPSVSGLAKWWKHEQGVRKCNYTYYTCRRAKDSNQDSCRSDRTACIAAAKASASASASNTAAATTATATTATSVIATSATDSASSATTTASSTTAVVAVSAAVDADAPLDSDDPSFDDDSPDGDS
ncbi:hypothetical protein FAVG1_11004 [Fusarium avenaceum]|nr:hypothetical protein FAVG1_11004 [Fusarium avenaceum]